MKKYSLSILTLAVFLLFFATNVSANEVPNTSASFAFNKDLSLGNSGSDVINLQTWLISNGYDIPSITSGASQKGYFGMQTKNAVKKYQLSVGVSGTGYVGPITRGKLNQIKIEVLKNKDINVLSPNGSEIWQLGSMKAISWNTSTTTNTGNGISIYIVQNMSGCFGPRKVACLAVVDPEFPIAENLTDTGAYTWNVGSWTPNMRSSTSTAPLTAKTLDAGSNYYVKVCIGRNIETRICDTSDGQFTLARPKTINVVNPNNGEKLISSSTVQIKWDYINATNKSQVDLYLLSAFECIPPNPGVSMTCLQTMNILDKKVPFDTEYNWIVGTDTNGNKIPNGRYSLSICVSGTDDCDQSDKPFYIVNADLIKMCPTERVINHMPTTYGTTTPSGNATSSVYYIYNGTRHELGEFDLNWVNTNCSVKETTVY